ncbi:MAG: site-2 protease family protein, partial [Atopobiaceae bacterium]|nr:site-2 protease family protein [Atopobiaceae bacterium]
MTQIMGFISVLFWGLLVLSLLVFIHEGGHYLAARLFGMRVTEFFLGLPSRLRLSHKSSKYGTEIGVTPILLGGYTRICGMEGEEDELLAPALACVQRHGRVSASELAFELDCDEDRAYSLLETLSDWAAIRPYYDPEKGEYKGQKTLTESYETLARDDRMLTEYDRDHDFSRPGSTAAGEPRPVDDAAAFLEAERSHTYLGCSFFQRIIALMAGPFVNVAFALLLVVLMLSVFGVEVTVDGETVLWHTDVITAIKFAFDYAATVAGFALRLIMPQHTMEVLESSSSVVGISVMASQAASTSVNELVMLIASVSMSLGFMNLLPIPPLDGGKILIEVVQLVLRRPISSRAQLAV